MTLYGQGVMRQLMFGYSLANIIYLSASTARFNPRYDSGTI
jgi:hypothetical protein